MGTEPLRMAFTVDCPAAHAFTVWTARISAWWPADHTVSGDAGLDVVLEPNVGGRIFERTPHGVEHDWGEVTRRDRAPRLGALGPDWREANKGGWSTLLPHYIAAV